MKSVIGVLAACGLAAAASGQVVMSQVYGGGGNTNAQYNADFVELHNIGNTSIDVGGWSVQYASWTSTNPTWSRVNIPSGPTTLLAPGQYFLVKVSATGANGAALPTPDVDGTAIAASATNGKVALVSDQVTITAGTTCPTGANIIDFVGYGSTGATTVACFEGTGPAPVLSNTTAALRLSNGCQESNNNAADFASGAPNPRNTSNSQACGFPDCNNNGVDDAIDIANQTSQDCNNDSVPDECQLSGLDCNTNGQIDSCEIAANGALDCNNNGLLDSCEIRQGILTDADGNNVADICEGAAVAECNVNATVNPAGIRQLTGGSDFLNVEGGSLGANAAYGAARWDISSLVNRFNTDFGPGQWEITRAYFYIQQSNAAFTVDSLPDAIEIMHSNLDSIDITPQAAVNPALQFPNFVTDWNDAQYILSYTFARGPGGSGGTAGSGTIESYQLFDLNGTNNAGMAAVAADLNTATGQITLLLKVNDTIDPFAAATYAGRTNSAWRGPTLVLWAQSTGPACDPDVNCDGSANGVDVEVQELAVGGDFTDYCQTGIPGVDDGDFNRDGAVNGTDVEAVENAVGGVCP
ncbi:MAG: hypothetical protein HBSAPP03_30240 [Phycisphaerae bacterium]|nr:MAG: hypothetical protein HBSAPP03_30240 [Phycisphaerae bacterium]